MSDKKIVYRAYNCQVTPIPVCPPDVTISRNQMTNRYKNYINC